MTKIVSAIPYFLVKKYSKKFSLEIWTSSNIFIHISLSKKGRYSHDYPPLRMPVWLKKHISCVTWLENAQLSVSFITFKSFDKCLTYQDSPLQIIFSHNLIFYNKNAVTFPDAFYNTTDYMYDLIQKKKQSSRVILT